MKQDAPDPIWTYSISLTDYKLVQGTGWCWILDRMPIEVAAILREIERAIDAKLYYLAIAVALSVPDICASLEFDPDNPKRANSETYAAWADANIGDRFQNLKGMDLYYLRCGVLHFGHFNHAKARFNRIMFIEPESAIKMHDVIVTVEPSVKFGGIGVEELRLSGKILQMGIVKFCHTILESARDWATSKANDPYVQRNLSALVRYRPEGRPPFSVGVPTIA